MAPRAPPRRANNATGDDEGDDANRQLEDLPIRQSTELRDPMGGSSHNTAQPTAELSHADRMQALAEERQLLEQQREVLEAERENERLRRALQERRSQSSDEDNRDDIGLNNNMTPAGSETQTRPSRRARHSSEEEDFAVGDTDGEDDHVRGRLPRATRRSIKPNAPKPYGGRTLAAYRNFMDSCELAFETVPEDFRLQRDRVTWAMGYLEDTARQAWWTKYKNLKREEQPIRWKDFADFLLNQVSDPVNRMRDAYVKYLAAAQRSDQDVRSFVTYLDTLEALLPLYSDEQQVGHLYAKLKPDIRRAIEQHNLVPKDREELINLAISMERTLKPTDRAGTMRRTGKEENGRPPFKRHKKANDSPRSRNTRGSPVNRTATAVGSSKDLIDVTCYKCQKKGHYATKCPQNGPATGVNTHEVRQGKYKASPNNRASRGGKR